MIERAGRREEAGVPRLLARVAMSILCCLATMWTVPPSEVAARTGARPASLGAVNLLSGKASGYVDVVVEEKVSLRNPWVGKGRPQFSIRGRGRFVGFALVGSAAEQGGERRAYLGGRLPRSAGSKLFLIELGGIPDGLDHENVTITPGGYRLYLLTGSSGARITLRLPKHRDVLRLDHSSNTHYVAKPLESYEPGVAPHVHSAGGSARLQGDGLLFQAAWFRNDAHLATDHSACFWRGEPRLPLAQTTNCGDVEVYEPPGIQRSRGTIDRRHSVGDGLRLYYGDAWVSGQGSRTWGQSVNLESASLAGEVHTLAFWLDLGT